jgi:hypothetical protein
MLIPLKCFQENMFWKMEKKEEEDSWKRALCISVRQTNLSRATTLPWYGMGLSLKFCGDPLLPIRNTRYAYNSWSHDQSVVNPHIRVDNRITSSITVLNNILTIGHMTKSDIATQGKSTTKQRIPSSIDDPCHAYYPTGNWLGDVPSLHRHRCSHHHHQ